MLKDNKPRVLFVDDEPSVLSALKRKLRDHAAIWDMDFIDHPRRAVAAHEDQAFDVVVTDLAMPTMNGLDLILAMRALGNKTTSFIVLSGTGNLNTAITAINHAQVYRFFTKPCPTDLLATGVAEALADRASRSAAWSEERAKLGLVALNRLAVGVIVVDETSRVLFANNAGTRLLAAQDGLVVAPGDVCRSALPAETALLHGIVRRVCLGEASEDEACGIALARPSLKRPLNVLVTATQELGERRALLFVTDPDAQALPDTETIARLFKVSSAESKLVRDLVSGLTLEQAAEKSGITIGTARTYLKQIFSKTDTNRQSELVKLVLTSPRILGPSDYA